MRRYRSGFTLVELLVVVVIIGVLIALILPAIGSARHKANVARVQAEISQMESAITAFKTAFGLEPPSHITLCEDPADWNLYPRDKAIIRRTWPQFDFSQSRDINRNNNMTEILDLNGSECLVFFLGGTIDDGETLNGFSNNPANPFLRQTGTSRKGPFIEFAHDRLVDGDNDGIREYQDTFKAGMPYVYYSSYEGRGYVPAELCFGMYAFYRPGQDPASKPYNNLTFQILSPGIDGLHGLGGWWLKEPPVDPATGSGVDPAYTFRQQPDDQDNITNFHGGELGR